ncbi:ATPase, T2SS/T4P/T4SS family [Paracidovorax wautersii]|uniref:Tfp pilus assembly protein PilT, pilus retraction ATPase n=1 Tax=Paracidovorax wautersii TaxID=1177982 RepID=A0A1I2HX05_9BURK|nr:ATPase, T2SS/T4P/T4SS family [Paracidovorax wautersii]SFF32881.1 Tfp pilus assembly protein PilT, pilus retraction ATPase [Paracidovorax wautersii]
MAYQDAALKMADLVTRIFTSQQGALFTDILIEPGLPMRARIAGQEWIDLVNQDEGDKPYVFSEERFDMAMGMFFSVDGRTANQEWKSIVRKAGGSAYPVQDMEIADQVEVAERGEDRALAGLDDSLVLRPLPPMNVGPVVHDRSRNYRVRMSVQQQQGGGYGAIMRCLRQVPHSVDALGLPEEPIKQLLDQRSGLILIAGPTGSGKSTTIAAMINMINQSRTCNICTIEDPIEYIHTRRKSSIVSRELGTDCGSFSAGVEQALRFVPDILVIGEIRDSATMREAVRAAESGILVIATLHAPNAIGAVRKAHGYLASEGDRMGLSGNLVGVIAQSLVLGKERQKFLAFELLDCRASSGDPGGRGVARRTIQSALDEAILTGSDKPFIEFAEDFREGRAGGLSESFKNVLDRLVKRGDIEARRAAMVPSDRETQLYFIRQGK